MENKVYAITDLNGYASQMRLEAVKAISDNYENDNLDEYISINEVVGIVDAHSLGMDENNRYLLDEESNEDVFDEVTVWINNIGLAKLAGKNLVECAWDNEANQMVFWAKDEENKNEKKKPTRRRTRKNMDSKKRDT